MVIAHFKNKQQIQSHQIAVRISQQLLFSLIRLPVSVLKIQSNEKHARTCKISVKINYAIPIANFPG